MQKRIFQSIFFTTLAAVLIVGAFTARSFYGFFDARTAEELRSETESIARALERLPDAGEYLASLTGPHRVTLIAPDGTVVFDNQTPTDDMENHIARPEVSDALQTGSGMSYRYSRTLTQKILYHALRLGDGRVLRTAATQNSIIGMVHRVLFPLAAVILITALLALSLSRAFARRITDPIGKIDLASPLENDAYDELSPILLRLQDQNDTLRSQLAELKRQRQELTAISENMSEGLLMLNREGIVLAINKSAARIFSVDAQASIGRSVLTLNRSAELYKIVEAAQNGRDGEAELELNGHIYQLLSTPVSGESSPGIVVIMLDVTARRLAEKERREFSANVSHELRTPLTSIVGFSEIMSNGVARPEDLKRFAAKIHSEAQRLIALVNDIIQLSRLDEKAELPAFETVDLYELCESVLPRVQSAAQARNVTVSMTGEHVSIRGIPRLLDELTFNLLENAVKYNVPDGSVTVSVAPEETGAVLSVQDTGLGIPKEHQERIFERFYRVDKSHSRETGGTGLGLAIVKHVAAVHDAKITLRSQPGEGSTFTVTFPQKA